MFYMRTVFKVLKKKLSPQTLLKLYCEWITRMTFIVLLWGFFSKVYVLILPFLLWYTIFWFSIYLIFLLIKFFKITCYCLLLSSSSYLNIIIHRPQRITWARFLNVYNIPAKPSNRPKHLYFLLYFIIFLWKKKIYVINEFVFYTYYRAVLYYNKLMYLDLYSLLGLLSSFLFSIIIFIKSTLLNILSWFFTAAPKGAWTLIFAVAKSDIEPSILFIDFISTLKTFSYFDNARSECIVIFYHGTIVTGPSGSFVK